jgi:hypothetical protein
VVSATAADRYAGPLFDFMAVKPEEYFAELYSILYTDEDNG